MHYLNFLTIAPEPEEPIPWIVYFLVVFLALWMLYILYHLLEGYITSITDRPLFRHLLIYKKLPPDQLRLLEENFSFYRKLSPKHQRQFEHRVSHFLSKKDFYGRDGVELTQRLQLLVASLACMLSFGRKNYIYHLVQTIIFYPEEFYSQRNDAYHQGEFNPRLKVIAFSKKHFEWGYEITNDNLNLGLHEFTHAMQMETRVVKDSDNARYQKYFNKILTHLRDTDSKSRLEKTRFFRSYAFTNQFEFMAVLTEYFFESPQELRSEYPELYTYLKKCLNFNFAGY
jgi:Mlc titration factor MtfA (ptsG expression regulator)